MSLTKKALLDLAKNFGVIGRHKMTKDDLDAAVKLAVAAQQNVGNYEYTLPFRVRQYYVAAKNDEAHVSLPPQAKAIFNFMQETGFVGTGAAIVKAAVAAGKLKTAQDPATLYAFYARKLEDAGVRLV